MKKKHLVVDDLFHGQFFTVYPLSNNLQGRERYPKRNVCDLSGTKIASQNRSDHGGRKRARNHFAAEIAGFFALPANPKNRSSR